MHKNLQLILADQHPLNPFLVRSHEFLCRAASFAENWPAEVELWIPSPVVDRDFCKQRVNHDLPENFKLRFGPPVQWLALGKRFSSQFWFRHWLKVQVKLLVASGKMACFYFRTIKQAWNLLPLLMKYNLPYAFEAHEVFYISARDPAFFFKMEKAVLECASIVFPISHSLAARLRQEFHIEAPVIVSPLGHTGSNLSLPVYDPTHEPRFLYIGSLHQWKGLDVALEAVAGLEVPFDVVGGGERLSATQEFSRKMHLKQVIFHGIVPPEKVPSIYTPGSICLLPLSNTVIASQFTSPLKLFEYLASARPVVAGDLPSTREIVQDRTHARLLPVGDPAVWKRELMGMLRDRKALMRMAMAGRKLATQCRWTDRSKSLVEELKRNLCQAHFEQRQ